ncbi:MAG: GNAT family N-acetyltransferase [Chitinophagales bacterium]
MISFPKLESKRLFLDKLKLEDAPLIAKYAGDKKISEFTLNIPFPYKEKDAVWWIQNSFKTFKENTQYTFGIYLKETQEFIGGIGLILDHKNKKASLGYWVAVPFWNKGFMTEAVNTIIDFGFKNLHLNKIFAQHLVENEASGRVMQKAGMLLEGTLAEHHLKNEKYRTVNQYRVLRSEFM